MRQTKLIKLEYSVRLKWQAAPAAAPSVISDFRENFWAYSHQTYTDIKSSSQCIWRCMSSARITYSCKDILRYQNSSNLNFEVHNKEILISLVVQIALALSTMDYYIVKPGEVAEQAVVIIRKGVYVTVIPHLGPKAGHAVHLRNYLASYTLIANHSHNGN